MLPGSPSETFFLYQYNQDRSNLSKELDLRKTKCTTFGGT
ncbi:hypothetical protein PORCRE_1676 [Porphyromonas crevioricanis JCM 15906]|uniref:Uncharacterized protein n=1 Tax=Porphyromonas crevioricanis JCM 15906 TaxID=1305617 RepID=T1CQ42_9PORP|nr:hypothetical protein PORCRE_1676 [Porphyromonas crevioricanis JCM 15906]